MVTKTGITIGANVPVSVVIPTYNGVAFIGEALESAFAQTLVPYLMATTREVPPGSRISKTCSLSEAGCIRDLTNIKKRIPHSFS